MKTKAFHREHEAKKNHEDRLYGTTTLGARGQVVIPAEARKALGLKPGDQLLVMSRWNKALGLMKADQLEELIDMIMDRVSGSPVEKEVKQRLKDFFGKIDS